MPTLATWPTNRTDAREPEWSKMISLQRRDGIYLNAPNTTDFSPSANPAGGMNVLIGSGDCVVGGFHGESTAQQILPIAAADAINPRIDRVVLHVDFTTPVTISLIVLTGNPALNPVPPSLTLTTSVREVPVCQVYVDPRISSIVASKVTDERAFTADRLLGTSSTQPLGRPGTRTPGVLPIPAPIDHSHDYDPLDLAANTIPAGIMVPFPGTDAPGWLACNGVAVSRGDYPALWAAIRDQFGNGDGRQTFNLPLKFYAANYIETYVIGPLDSSGNGYAQISRDFGLFRGVFDLGPYPPNDGYWPLPSLGAQAYAGTTIITAKGGTPTGTVQVFAQWSDVPIPMIIKAH